MNLERYLHLQKAVERWQVNLERGEIYTRKGLSNTLGSDGYKRIGSKIKGKYVSYGVHEVIAYVGGLNLLGEGLEVNHINGNKLDNRLVNLEVVTRKENIRHAFRLGLNRGRKFEEHNRTKLSNKDVLEIKEALKEGVTGVELSKKFRVSRSTISAIKTNRNWSNLKEELKHEKQQ